MQIGFKKTFALIIVIYILSNLSFCKHASIGNYQLKSSHDSSGKPTATSSNTLSGLEPLEKKTRIAFDQYLSVLFGYGNGRPAIFNPNWELDLKVAYKAVQESCEPRISQCRAVNYNLLKTWGSTLGHLLFNNYFQAQPQFLICQGTFNDYFAGTVRGGWLQEIYITAGAVSRDSGTSNQNPTLNQRNSAHVLFFHLTQTFKQNYQSHIAENRCLNISNITPHIPCKYGIGICNYGNRIFFPDYNFLNPMVCSDMGCSDPAQITASRQTVHTFALLFEGATPHQLLNIKHHIVRLPGFKTVREKYSESLAISERGYSYYTSLGVNQLKIKFRDILQQLGLRASMMVQGDKFKITIL